MTHHPIDLLPTAVFSLALTFGVLYIPLSVVTPSKDVLSPSHPGSSSFAEAKVKKATHPPHDKSQLFHHYSIF
jgi:hypothetical protein